MGQPLKKHNTPLDIFSGQGINMKKSIQMSIVCGIIGLVAGVFVSVNAIGVGYNPPWCVFGCNSN
jgi:hypothetical protein